MVKWYKENLSCTKSFCVLCVFLCALCVKKSGQVNEWTSEREKKSAKIRLIRKIRVAINLCKSIQSVLSVC